MAQTHLANGRWYLTSSAHVDELLQALECSTKIRRKLSPLLTETGPTGHVQDFIIDLQLKAVRFCIYARDVLMREYVIPLEEEVPYWGISDKFIMMRAQTDSIDKLSGTEYGDNHTAHWNAEVTGNSGNMLIWTWISGDVVCTMTFKKMDQ